MAELPDDGDRGELWRVRVPVVFEIAARSRAQARGIVDQALTSRSIGALSAPKGREGIRGWSHQEDSYPGLNTSASTQQTFLADLTTIEVVRTLVETEAQEPGLLRVLFIGYAWLPIAFFAFATESLIAPPAKLSGSSLPSTRSASVIAGRAPPRW